MLVLGIRTVLPEDAAATLSGGTGENLAGLSGLEATVVRVEVVHRTARDDPATERVLTVDRERRTLRLLERLEATANRELGFLDVPVGFVFQVRLIPEAVAIDLRGETHPVSVPSGSNTGLKVVPLDGVPFEIIKGERTGALILFNPFEQLVRNKGQGFHLKPVVTAEHVPLEELTSLVHDQLVVRFKNGTPQDQIDAAIRARNMTVLTVWRPTNYYTLQLPSGGDAREVLEFYAGHAAVLYAAPNSVVQTLAIDPELKDQVQWPQVGLTRAADGTIDPSSGWALTTGSHRVVVAIVDDGVMLNHPDLIENIYINEAEIPGAVLAQVGDRNGDGATTPADLDEDRNGVVTFGDLDRLNAALDPDVCPAANSEPSTRCDPLDLVNGAGVQELPIRCTPGQAPPGEPLGYGWQDGVDNDCNGFIDDLVGWSFHQRNNLSHPLDPSYRHGTAVAGIVGAVGDNGLSISGVAWNVRLLPVATHAGAFNRRELIFRNSVVHAFHYAGLMGAHVLNASLGCYVLVEGFAPCRRGIFGSSRQCGEYDLSPAKHKAFTDALRKELEDVQARLAPTTLVLAAGNCSLDHDREGVFFWPGVMEGNNVLRVASVGARGYPNEDELSTFSDRGSRTVDLAAPGEQFVVLTVDGGTMRGCLERPDAGCAGTSYAAPMVAGAAALLLSREPSLDSCRVTDRILRNADEIDGLRGSAGPAGRRLNARRALEDVISVPVRSCGP